MPDLRYIAAALAVSAQILLSYATPMVPLVVPGPTVTLDKGVFQGSTKGKTAQFAGIPFAHPPVDDRRFRLPEPLPPYEGAYDATAYGNSCPQQAMTLPGWVNNELQKAINSVVNNIYRALTPEGEDCLTINVVKPANAPPFAKLPVAVWIFGGGFEMGGTSTYELPGKDFVERSMDMGTPTIYVSMNYRLSAFGFLASKEVREAGVGNLGLQDQRLALKWIQKYIANFGGDPTKVTIWGESAGAISVSLHMLTNDGNTEGLFRGAIMQSGGPIPVADVENGQPYYDRIVQGTGCGGSNDTLQCLRELPFETLSKEVDKSPNFFSYQGLVLAWLPRVDGVFLTQPPQRQVLTGPVANVPMITGNCDDEGSLFSISSANITDEDEVRTFLKEFMLPNATEYELDLLLRHYPGLPSAGCPFDTGFRNMLGPQYKRVAAIQGDVVFHSPRRFFLKNLAGKQNSWSFLSKRMKDLAFMGSAHATDILNAFGDGELRDYIIRFVNTLDPNGGRAHAWPKYDLQNPQAVVFQDSAIWPVISVQDDYRKDAMAFVANLSLLHPL